MSTVAGQLVGQHCTHRLSVVAFHCLPILSPMGPFRGAALTSKCATTWQQQDGAARPMLFLFNCARALRPNPTFSIL